MALTPDTGLPGTAGDIEANAPVEPLACGRDAAEVWDHAEAGTLDEHERSCPHCGAAAADARGLEAMVGRLAQEPLIPPASVVDRVVGAVLAELRPRDLIPLDSPHGPAALDATAAAAVLRGVVDAMAGMRARSCRITRPSATGGAPGPAEVAMTVTARFGVDLASATARVRQMVVAAGEQALGVPVARVDIEVVDVFVDEAFVDEPGVAR
ncbi:MAG: Asp23/Gls24 family envelope stress response protein [Candidatus Nanopelagicales bacterium]|uniref:Asp23/Gls24 family envelope stress response protein n=1 Tax=Pseudonocardia sp. TaxID=60912 RepID=UPI0026D1AEE6